MGFSLSMTLEMIYREANLNQKRSFGFKFVKHTVKGNQESQKMKTLPLVIFFNVLLILLLDTATIGLNSSILTRNVKVYSFGIFVYSYLRTILLVFRCNLY